MATEKNERYGRVMKIFLQYIATNAIKKQKMFYKNLENINRMKRKGKEMDNFFRQIYKLIIRIFEKANEILQVICDSHDCIFHFIDFVTRLYYFIIFQEKKRDEYF